jgi:hypothetical protein
MIQLIDKMNQAMDSLGDSFVCVPINVGMRLIGVSCVVLLLLVDYFLQPLLRSVRLDCLLLMVPRKELCSSICPRI